MSQRLLHTASAALLVALFCIACADVAKQKEVPPAPIDTTVSKNQPSSPVEIISPALIDTVHPDSLVAFARTLKGIPYLYASTDPAKGFDCSGFITYVFNHFHIKVPRSSIDFTNYGKRIALRAARPGDLILFTGTDSSIRKVGHMGIVESWRNDTLYFIHSSSGAKANGVVITPLGKYYMGRFEKVIRVLEFPRTLPE